jgi:hypothetical protein
MASPSGVNLDPEDVDRLAEALCRALRGWYLLNRRSGDSTSEENNDAAVGPE